MAAYLVALTLGVVPLVLLVVGVNAGLRLSHPVTLPQRGWPELVLWMIVIWSLAIALPWGLRLADVNLMHWLLIPPYPGAVTVERTIHWGDRENHSDNVQMILSVPASQAVIVSMYSPLLEARG
jgi:hypothetical protein